MTREYETIAALWQSFHELMRGQRDEGADDMSGDAADHAAHGLPGTGGHVLTTSSKSGGSGGGTLEEQQNS